MRKLKFILKKSMERNYNHFKNQPNQKAFIDLESAEAPGGKKYSELTTSVRDSFIGKEASFEPVLPN